TVGAAHARLPSRRPPVEAGSPPESPAPTEPPRLLLPPGESFAAESPGPAEALRDQEDGPAVVLDDRVVEHPALQLLTAREREVARLVARGYSNADICEACYISEGTVKTHVRNILGKLDLRDRTQVAVFAYESGLVRPGAWRERVG
ncbi:MAG TPA: response regulator transcription factor, partial [Dehalococcoidia bacterium]|nr:response regulator transcription factor [Dehalococcoidia bacterium]